ncbi:MAG: hypothetical protein AAGC93_20780 [Cyanobacteria bacterium P01_F01_bin.53]
MPRHLRTRKKIPKQSFYVVDSHQLQTRPFVIQQARFNSFPQADKIEKAVGQPIPGMAVFDTVGCQQRNVPAFTEGNISHFSSTAPSLHVAAHEATHQLQHSGKTKDANLGPELHAHVVADTVSKSNSAHHLIGSNGSHVSSGIHNYTEFTTDQQNAKSQWQVGSLARVADNGQTVTTGMMHECYAEPALIKETNEILTAKKSGIELSPGADRISGQAPDGSGLKNLASVKAKIRASDSVSGTQNFWADCGRSSREVMGPHNADESPRGIYKTGGGTEKETVSGYNPAKFRDEILVKSGIGSTPEEAHKNYLRLTPAEKLTFDKKHGINKYAVPGVGEAFTSRRDDKETGEGFNFHWGGVVMAPGHDRVTLENFAKPGTNYDTKDEKWFFETYGPPHKPGQTFHEQYEGSVGEKGKNNTTMAATTTDYADMATRLSTVGLIKLLNKSNNEAEKLALETELKTRNVTVAVKVKSTEDWLGADEVYVKVSNGSTSLKTIAVALNNGQSHTFRIPVSNLFPLSGPIKLEVYDQDSPDADDLIVDLNWKFPFSSMSNATSLDGANYSVNVKFDR